MKLERLFAFSTAVLAFAALAIAGCSKPEPAAAPTGDTAPTTTTATPGTPGAPAQGVRSDKPVAEGAGSAAQPQ